ncbi:DnaB helicase C-terminal domain-containing protein [Staphylococcus canis]|uniref:AAA family ATPase n=1 Tax=Staphylococcus canis TaxID=2724942 RepID=A0ABS0T8Y5_9STAP|nr:DnaB helicase C-terminal domain-containing protein [Staphylococcus canis]MBI5975181.1 AAA family ATPase [Staphylococcus canis]
MIDRINTEQAIVTNLMKHPDLISKFKLKPHMFLDENVKKIIEHILETGKANVNEIYFKARDDKDFIDIKKFNQIVKSDAADRTFFIQDQMNLINHYAMQIAIEKSQHFLEMPTRTNFNVLIDELEQLKELKIEQGAKTDEFLAKVMESVLSDKPKEMIKTGYPLLDYKIHGYERGQLNVIAARPSMGKTGFALQTLWNIAKQGYEVSFFSLETTGDRIIERLAATISGVALTDIKRPQELNAENTNKIMQALDMIKKHDINIYDESRLTPSRVREQAFKESDKPQIIFIDYLQLMESDTPTNDRRVDVEKISRDLKIIANETGSVVVLLSQLNRGVEARNDKRPMMSDLKESGGIEADASMIFMLYRDDYYNRDDEQDSDKSDLEVNIAKNKDGETGVVNFEYYKSTQRFFT